MSTRSEFSVEEVTEFVRTGLDWLPVSALERLAASYFSPSALRRRRDAARDNAYRALAVLISSATSSGHEMARDVHRALQRYAASAWRFDRGRAAPADTERALLHKILTLDGGRVLSVSSIRRVLSGT